jgi:hypothetical protein
MFSDRVHDPEKLTSEGTDASGDPIRNKSMKFETGQADHADAEAALSPPGFDDCPGRGEQHLLTSAVRQLTLKVQASPPSPWSIIAWLFGHHRGGRLSAFSIRPHPPARMRGAVWTTSLILAG